MGNKEYVIYSFSSHPFPRFKFITLPIFHRGSPFPLPEFYVYSIWYIAQHRIISLTLTPFSFCLWIMVFFFFIRHASPLLTSLSYFQTTLLFHSDLMFSFYSSNSADLSSRTFPAVLNNPLKCFPPPPQPLVSIHILPFFVLFLLLSLADLFCLLCFVFPCSNKCVRFPRVRHFYLPLSIVAYCIYSALYNIPYWREISLACYFFLNLPFSIEHRDG